MSEIGILLPSFFRQSMFLEQCFDSLSKVDYPIVFIWDDIEFSYEHKIPDNIEIIITGKILGHQVGERVETILGARKLEQMGCKYILKSAGDHIIQYPENIVDLIDEMDGYNFLANKIVHGSGFYTKMFFAEIDPLINLATCSARNIVESGIVFGVEEHYAKFINELGYKDRKFDIKSHIGFVDLQWYWQDGIRQDDEIIALVHDLLVLSGRLPKREVMYDKLRQYAENNSPKYDDVSLIVGKLISRIAYKSLPLDVKVVAMLFNVDGKITPIVDPWYNEEDCSRTIKIWFDDVVRSGIDWTNNSCLCVRVS